MIAYFGFVLLLLLWLAFTFLAGVYLSGFLAAYHDWVLAPHKEDLASPALGWTLACTLGSVGVAIMILMYGLVWLL